MPLQLTERQQLLFDRLVTLSEWAAEGELPVRVLEIRGFGSFFRGKREPSDVDLILRVQHPDHTPQFSRFLELLNLMRDDGGYQREFKTPAEAVRVAFEQSCEGPLPGNDIDDQEARRYANWLEGFTWRTLYPKTASRQEALESPREYAKRLIKRSLPDLNVVEMQSPWEVSPHPSGIRCGFTVSVWSEHRPDTVENLRRLFSREMLLLNNSCEMAYFGAQLPLVKARVAFLRCQIDILFKTPRTRKAVAVPQQWLYELCDRQAEGREAKQRFKQACRIANEFDSEEWGKPGALPSDTGIRSVDAEAREVDRKRKSIKDQYQEIDLLKSVVKVLLRYKSGEVETQLSPREYVVSEMMGRSRTAARPRIATFLKDMGLPVAKWTQGQE